MEARMKFCSFLKTRIAPLALCASILTGCPVDDPEPLVSGTPHALSAPVAPIVKLSVNKAITTCLQGAICSSAVDGFAIAPRLTADGNKLLFHTRNNSRTGNVYLDDLVTGARTAVAAQPLDAEIDLAVSADGRYVALADGQGFGRIDVTTGARSNVAQPGTAGLVGVLDLSADGRYLAFMSTIAYSTADTNGAPDVYVYDFSTQAYDRVTLNEAGGQLTHSPTVGDPQISADGRYVTWFARNSFDVNGIYRFDRTLRRTECAGGHVDGTCTSVTQTNGYTPKMSADGRFVAHHFPYGVSQYFLKDMVTKASILLPMMTKAAMPEQGLESVALSPNGRYLVFLTRATNLGVDNPANNRNVFIQDLHTHEIHPVSDHTTRPGVHAANAVVAGNRVVWNELSSGGPQIMGRLLPTTTPASALAVINYHERYKLTRYQNVGALSSYLAIDFDGEEIAAISGSGTMPNGYGGTDHLEIQLSRVAGALRGYVWIDGSASCTETLRFQSYWNTCTPNVFGGAAPSGINVSTYTDWASSFTATKVSNTEVMLQFIGRPDHDGDRPGLRLSLAVPTPSRVSYNPDFRLHVSAYNDRLISAEPGRPTAMSTDRTADATHFTFVQISGPASKVVQAGDMVAIRTSTGSYLKRVGSDMGYGTSSAEPAARWVIESPDRAAGQEIRWGIDRVRFRASEYADKRIKSKNEGANLQVYTGTGSDGIFRLYPAVQPDPAAP